jgi:hypothetical protein
MTDIVKVALIMSLPSTVSMIISGFTHKKLDTVKTEINGRMTQLLEVTKSASFAEGRRDEKEHPDGRC